LLKDLVIAADQLLYNLQVVKPIPTNSPHETIGRGGRLGLIIQRSTERTPRRDKD